MSIFLISHSQRVTSSKYMLFGLSVLLLINLVLISNSQASDELGKPFSNQINLYGLGINESSLSANGSLLAKGSKFSKNFEFNYQNIESAQSLKKKKHHEPVLTFEVEYQDETANLNSPFHAANTDLYYSHDNTSKEYQTRMGYEFEHLTPNASFTYSPDSYGFGEYYNYGLGVAVPVKELLSLETHYGWNKFEKNSEQGGRSDYQEWSVGVSTTYNGMKIKVDYIDMNASEKSQECGQLYSCEGKTVFSIIKDF